MHKVPVALLVTATASAALIAAPAASAATGESSTATTCSSTRANTTSPVVGRTKTYPVGSVGTVTLNRTAARTIQVVSTAPAAGYTTVVKIPSGARIQVAFRRTGSTLHVYFGASPGHTVPDRLHTTVTTCT